MGRQMPWVSEEDGMFAPKFIEERRQKLEEFIIKMGSHPIAQKEKSLHIFLQDPEINRDYTPGKVDARLNRAPTA